MTGRMRVCAEPGCGRMTDRSRCKAHRREQYAKWGSRQARGYGNAHAAERRRYELLLEHGTVLTCATCPTELRQGDKWDLGHNTDRTGYIGPQCIPCNRNTAT